MFRRCSAKCAAGAVMALLGLVTPVFAASTTRAADVAPPPAVAAAPVPVYGYRIKSRFPHDPQAFTQGLVFDGGVLYESTGLYGQSTVREVELQTGKVRRALRLPDRAFGEGLAVLGDTLVQLTWREGVAFVFDKRTFQLRQQFRYNTQGWGLTSDGQQFIMSDGSDRLYFLSRQDFSVAKTLTVTAEGGSVDQLNELEYVDGAVYANVWHSDRVARIDPQSGRVTAWIDLAGLRGPRERAEQEAVLNGIAYDPNGRRWFVTGKRWSTLFEIEFVPPP